MSNPALDELVKKSTELLSKLVKKTPVTAKLLSKPPFRYLHDLLTEISKTHKLAAGLFSATEMVAENVKDKAAKVAYLQKWIDCTEFATNLKVRLNPLKLVAGLEPEETNAFLQLVAKMALKKVNTAPAVDKVLHGLKFNEKAPDTAAEEKQLNEAIEPSETNPQELPETNEPSIVSIKQKVEQELHITQETTSIAQPRSRNPSNQPRIDKSKPTNDDESSNKMKLSPEYPSDKDAQDDESGLQIPVESSSLQNSTSQSTISAPSSGRRARPVSARPPPPKVRSVNITQDQISKAAPVIIREGAEAEDDEFLVQMADENLKLPNTGFPLETSDKHGYMKLTQVALYKRYFKQRRICRASK